MGNSFAVGPIDCGGSKMMTLNEGTDLALKYAQMVNGEKREIGVNTYHDAAEWFKECGGIADDYNVFMDLVQVWMKNTFELKMSDAYLNIPRWEDSGKKISEQTCKMPSLKWKDTPLMAEGDIHREAGTSPLGTYTVWQSEGFGVQMNFYKNIASVAENEIYLGEAKSISEAKEFCEEQYRKLFCETFGI